MSLTVGLRIGESFVEAVGLNGATVTVQERWYLPKRPLLDGMKDVFSKLTSGELSSPGNRVLISSSRIEQSLTRRQGAVPAFITTSGFESWLPLHAPLLTPAFAAQPQRKWIPVDQERTFGVSERISSDGSVDQPLKMEDLEFLVSKLELSKIKNVAIGFLHSDLNSSHEEQAATYLKERGFEVFTSVQAAAAHEGRFSTEAERWLAAIEAAYVQKTGQEDLLALEAALQEILGEARPAWTVEAWTSTVLKAVTDIAPFELRSGFEASLLNSVRGSSESLVLHLGLENIFALRKSADPVQLAQILTIPVQATSTIQIGDWSVPQFTLSAKGFEPGPMLFGKSHHLTPIDILYVCGHLEMQADFQELVNEKSRARILESLFTLGKMIPGGEAKSSIDAKDVATALETAWVETIVATLTRWAPKSIRLTGALAQSLLPLLSKRRPDWAFAIGVESEMAEGFAAAAIAMKAPLSLSLAKVISQPHPGDMPGLSSAAISKSKAASAKIAAAKTAVSKSPAKPAVKTVTRGGGLK